MNRNTPPPYFKQTEASDRSLPVIRRLLLVAVGAVVILILTFRGCGTKPDHDHPEIGKIPQRPGVPGQSSPDQQPQGPQIMEGNLRYEILIPAKK